MRNIECLAVASVNKLTQQNLSVFAERFLRLRVVGELLLEFGGLLGHFWEGVSERALRLHHVIEVVGERTRETQNVRVLPLCVAQSLDLSLQLHVHCLAALSINSTENIHDCKWFTFKQNSPKRCIFLPQRSPIPFQFAWICTKFCAKKKKKKAVWLYLVHRKKQPQTNSFYCSLTNRQRYEYGTEIETDEHWPSRSARRASAWCICTCWTTTAWWSRASRRWHSSCCYRACLPCRPHPRLTPGNPESRSSPDSTAGCYSSLQRVKPKTSKYFDPQASVGFFFFFFFCVCVALCRAKEFRQSSEDSDQTRWWDCHPQGRWSFFVRKVTSNGDSKAFMTFWVNAFHFWRAWQRNYGNYFSAWKQDWLNFSLPVVLCIFVIVL